MNLKDNQKLHLNNKRKSYFVLSFEYEFEHDEDEVYFAQIPPYTYSQLINIIKPLSYNQLNDDGKAQFMLESSLCKSLSGMPIQLLTITDYNDQTISLAQRKVIVVIARMHPGETTGSWMCQGVIESLLSNNSEIQQLRRKVIFKVIPMMNPDGVVIGNYRTGLAGLDLNRQFGEGSITNQNNQLFPSVNALKLLIKTLKESHGNNMMGFIDLHGHSVKKNIFTFGPQYAPTDFRYYRSKFIPKLIEKKSKYFRYYSCTYNSQKASKQTARVAFLLKYNLEICYTIESTFGLYYKSDTKKIETMATQDWINFGIALPFALKEYIEMMDTYSIIKEAQDQKLNQERQQNNSPPKRQTNQSPNRASSTIRIKSSNLLKEQNENSDFIPYDESQIYNLGGLMKEIQHQERQLNSQQANSELVDSSDNYSDNQADSEPSDEDIPTDQRNKLFSNIEHYQKNFTKFVMGQKKTAEKLVIEGGEDKRDKIITHKLKRAALSVDRESKKKKGKKKKKQANSILQNGEVFPNENDNVEMSLNRTEQFRLSQKQSNVDLDYSEKSQMQKKMNNSQIFLEDNQEESMSGMFLADLKKKKKQRTHRLKVQKKNTSLNLSDNLIDDFQGNSSFNDEEEDEDQLRQYKIMYLSRKLNTQISQNSQHIANQYYQQKMFENYQSPEQIYEESPSEYNNAYEESQIITANNVKYKNSLPHFYKRIPKNRVPMKLNIICDKFQTTNKNGVNATPASNAQQATPFSQDQLQYPAYLEQARNIQQNQLNQEINYPSPNQEQKRIHQNLYNQIISSALKNNITHKIESYQKQYNQSNAGNEMNSQVKQSNEIKLPQIENRQVRAFNQTGAHIPMKTNRVNTYQIPIMEQLVQDSMDSETLKKEILKYKRQSHHTQRHEKKIQNVPVYSMSPIQQNQQRTQNNSSLQHNNLVKSGGKFSQQQYQQQINYDLPYQNQSNVQNSSRNINKKEITPARNTNNEGIIKSQNSIEIDDAVSNVISSNNRSQHHIASQGFLPGLNMDFHHSNLDLNNVQTNPSLLVSQNYGNSERRYDKNYQNGANTQIISTSSAQYDQNKIIQSISNTTKNYMNMNGNTKNSTQSYLVKENKPFISESFNYIKMKELVQKEVEQNYDTPTVQPKETYNAIRHHDKLRNASDENGKKRISPAIHERRSSIQNNQAINKQKLSNQKTNNSIRLTTYIQQIDDTSNHNNNNFMSNNGQLKTNLPYQTKPSKALQLQFLQRQKINLN